MCCRHGGEGEREGECILACDDGEKRKPVYGDDDLRPWCSWGLSSQGCYTGLT